MITKTIKFTDYNGNPREEEHYFNLSKAEIIEWLMTNGDYTLDKALERMYKERNGKQIMETFRDLIYRSYGKPSLDGRRFDKSEEVKREFMETEAYSQLFMDIVTDAKKASAFINGIIPKDLAAEVEKALSENEEGIPAEVKDYLLEKPNVVEINNHFLQ